MFKKKLDVLLNFLTVKFFELKYRNLGKLITSNCCYRVLGSKQIKLILPAPLSSKAIHYLQFDLTHIYMKTDYGTWIRYSKTPLPREIRERFMELAKSYEPLDESNGNSYPLGYLHAIAPGHDYGANGALSIHGATCMLHEILKWLKIDKDKIQKE